MKSSRVWKKQTGLFNADSPVAELQRRVVVSVDDIWLCVLPSKGADRLEGAHHAPLVFPSRPRRRVKPLTA